MGTASPCVSFPLDRFQLPFLFILAGGLLIESTHGRLQFTAPLTAITAAVVGVIASLAVFFIGHIAYRASGELDFEALALVALAVLALFRFKLGVSRVIAVCAVTGMVLRLAGVA